jgi:sugar/nucleoside kinase (ribokinase family)
MAIDVYGIGNPLMDVLVNISDKELQKLNLQKGVMHLIDPSQHKTLESYIKNKPQILIPGGSCPNTIISLAKLGLKTTLAGCIGDDKLGKEYQKQLKKYKIISNLYTSQTPTGSSTIMISKDGERTMNTYLGASQKFSKQNLNEELIANSKYIHFTGYMWDTENQKEAIQKAIEISQKNSTKIIFDVADPFAVNRNKDVFLDLIKNYTDIAFANEEEAKTLFNTDNPDKAAKELSGLCDIGIIKLGKKGSLIQTKKEKIHIPANIVEAIDTTGAGDMYTSGFIYGLSKDYSLEKSGKLASFLASQIVTQVGAQFNDEDFDKIKKEIKRNS